MCGILGGTWAGESLLTIQEQCRNGLTDLVHRGPDAEGELYISTDSGTIALCHRRLAIIDLSPLAAQPTSTPDGRLRLIFNGEIYNYKELGKELISLGRTFRTKSDTEVLLNAWDEWGAACLHKLNGMFAFVIYDSRTRKIYGARDRFGIKPLYIHTNCNGLRFASEIRALRRISQRSFEIDPQVAYNYLAHGLYDDGHNTFLKDIKALPPGNLFVFDTQTGKYSSSEWCTHSVLPEHQVSFEDASEELRRLIIKSVQMHLQSDVPLGVALSGGLDSSIIASCIRHLEPDASIQTFSYVASDKRLSEEPWINYLNGEIKGKACKITIGPQDLLADMDDLIMSQGEPFGSFSVYAQWRVFQKARECGMVVMLDGQGADELLGGYQGYPGLHARSLVDLGHFSKAISFLQAWGQLPSRNPREGWMAFCASFLGPKQYGIFRALLKKPEALAWLNMGYFEQKHVQTRYPSLSPTPNIPGKRALVEMARSLTGLGLQALVRHADRNSMRFSMESRVPFLNHEISDFCLRVPESFHLSPNGETKMLLRSAMDKIAPRHILDRRDKISFETPDNHFLKYLSTFIIELVTDAPESPFIRKHELLIELERVGENFNEYARSLWRAVIFLRWQQLASVN